MSIATMASAQVSSLPMQAAAARAMGQRAGAAVVVDVASGKLLAAYPRDVAARRVALPGSSIKPFSLLTLLQSDKVNPQTVLMCRRTVSIGGHNLTCAHPATTGPLDPATALAYSCNSYFTTVATRLQPEELYQGFLHAGFGAPTGAMSGESAGDVRKAPSRELLQLQAVGEWGIEVTPLQLAYAYRRVALLAAANGAKLAPLFDGLSGSVQYGWGQLSQAAGSTSVAGKTGTALSENGAGSHAWFAGFSPAKSPAIVVCVFLERGRGSDAAAVAQAIFSAYSSKSLASRASGGRQP